MDFQGPHQGSTQCEKGPQKGVTTGPRMRPHLYSAAGNGDGPGVIHAYGGPVATATIGAVAAPGQSL